MLADLAQKRLVLGPFVNARGIELLYASVIRLFVEALIDDLRAKLVLRRLDLAGIVMWHHKRRKDRLCSFLRPPTRSRLVGLAGVLRVQIPNLRRMR